MNMSPRHYFVQPPPEWQTGETCSGMHLAPAEHCIRTLSHPKSFVEQTISPLQTPQTSGDVGSSSSEYLCDTMDSRECQENSDPDVRYSSSLASLLQMQSGSHAIFEGAILRELIGRLGINAGNNDTSFASSHTVDMHSPSFKSANGWKVVDASSNRGLSLDPVKGYDGMALSTSHGFKLAQCTSDPGFAERTARCLPIGNGSYSYLGQPFACSAGEKGYLRPEGSQTFANRVSKTSSLLNLNTFAMRTPPVSSATAKRTKDTQTCDATSHAEMNNDQALYSESEHTAIERSKFSICPSTSIQGERRAMELRNQFGETPLSIGAEHSSNSGKNAEELRFPDDYGARLRKKRKSISEEKTKDEYHVMSVPNGKKSATDAITSTKEQKFPENRKENDEARLKVERTATEHVKDSGSKSAKDVSKPPADPPKLDYIHVRARRGQATDSHSLAERVRREKISERMRFLQDLVPGCSKVTGKALMLDEIINYVQSLQRQVEFLSMKLATVNPRWDLSLDNIFDKEILQAHLPTHSSGLATELIPNLGMLNNVQQNRRQIGSIVGFDFLSADSGLDTRLTRMANAPMLSTFGDSISQTPGLWDGELQSVIQMGFGSSILAPTGSESL
ncbi:hypothetical protein O6H91_02G112000 [Diphasiastrum complanatum]|uniref:Uncharacterized protein n=1 Tax=Diphasiastrum complanatum TaxID=34168 RepID=A0ACC2EJN1_DIPCM|nr:hypothetical protein O6H91_Y218300 [Diphasiastrum complanatum]KAJ7566631.1 hypothetical protein O6H91_02G112000 [Diphasiastrum complanatum]